MASAAAPRHGRAPDLPRVRPVIASPDPEPDGLVSVGSLLRREGRRAAHAVDRPLVPRARDLLEAGARTSTHRAAVAAGALLAVTTVLGSNALGDGTFISGVGVDEAADAGPAAVPPPAEPLPLAAADAPVRQVMAALQSAGTRCGRSWSTARSAPGFPGAPRSPVRGSSRRRSARRPSTRAAPRGPDRRRATTTAAPTTARRRAGRTTRAATPAATSAATPAATPTGTTAAPGRTTARRRGPSSPCRARIPTCPRPSPARTSSTDRSAVRVRRRTAIPTAAPQRLGRRIRRRHRGRLRQPSVRRRRGHRRRLRDPGRWRGAGRRRGRPVLGRRLLERQLLERHRVGRRHVLGRQLLRRQLVGRRLLERHLVGRPGT